MKRRSVLSGISLLVAGATGCLGLGFDGIADLTITNERSEPITVTVRATTIDDGETVLSSNPTIEPGNSREYPDVSSGETIRVVIRVSDGSEVTHEWSDGNSDASGLFVSVTRDGLDVDEVVE